MSRNITPTDQAEAFAQLRAAMETELTLRAIDKERIHRDRVAQLHTSLAMMRCGVKVLAGEPMITTTGEGA